MMLPAPHVAELRRALHALEQVLALRLQERRAATAAVGATGDPAHGVQGKVDEGLPSIEVFDGSGPLATVVRDCRLSAEEALILVAAMAPEIDERFGPLLAMLSDRPGAAGLTGEGARNLVGRSFESRLRAAGLLSSRAPLRSLGLIHLDPAEPGPLAGSLRPDRDLVAWALGRPYEPPGQSPDFPAVPASTVHTLDDVIVPGPVREQLIELRGRIVHRRRVTTEWGFTRRHDNVRGVVALFHGPSGTGKTMAAAVVAKEAGLAAYQIDLSALVSKYIGETEKNLARVFDHAEREDAVIIFDEADAIFGRRTEVHEARDRYANQEVSYLLQRIERHPGIVILTTNLLANVDEAFLRRVHVVVAFPAPTVSERAALWRSVPPEELPVDDRIDFTELAARFELTGAQIRDATLDAAYLAAADGQRVTPELLEAAIRNQYAKAGRMYPMPP